MDTITTTSLRLTVDQVSSSTLNVGLSEIKVLGELDPAASGAGALGVVDMSFL
jgi:hypothetical protein